MAECVELRALRADAAGEDFAVARVPGERDAAGGEILQARRARRRTDSAASCCSAPARFRRPATLGSARWAAQRRRVAKPCVLPLPRSSLAPHPSGPASGTPSEILTARAAVSDGEKKKQKENSGDKKPVAHDISCWCVEPFNTT